MHWFNTNSTFIRGSVKLGTIGKNVTNSLLGTQLISGAMSAVHQVVKK